MLGWPPLVRGPTARPFVPKGSANICGVWKVPFPLPRSTAKPAPDPSGPPRGIVATRSSLWSALKSAAPSLPLLVGREAAKTPGLNAPPPREPADAARAAQGDVWNSVAVEVPDDRVTQGVIASRLVEDPRLKCSVAKIGRASCR